MSTGYCHRNGKRLSTNFFDIMKFKILFHLNCDSPKYIAKLISLSMFISKLSRSQFSMENCSSRILDQKNQNWLWYSETDTFNSYLVVIYDGLLLFIMITFMFRPSKICFEELVLCWHCFFSKCWDAGNCFYRECQYFCHLLSYICMF